MYQKFRLFFTSEIRLDSLPVVYIEKSLKDILILFFIFSWGEVFKREIVHWIFLGNIHNNKYRIQNAWRIVS